MDMYYVNEMEATCKPFSLCVSKMLNYHWHPGFPVTYRWTLVNHCGSYEGCNL